MNARKYRNVNENRNNDDYNCVIVSIRFEIAHKIMKKIQVIVKYQSNLGSNSVCVCCECLPTC